MELHIYNSLHKKLEVFIPLEPGKVKMYVCGPTVYNYLHVGNFRGPVVFNMVRNWLEYLGYQVSYALNFTDVDDKIIARALEEGVSPEQLAQKYIHEYRTDFLSLGLRPHDFNPTVTESMSEIIQMIQTLVEKKKAYSVNGDVNFSIQSFAEYGSLSGRKPEDMLQGVRIEADQKKLNPLDFALWKSAKAGEPSWPSPWGPGRPGWHIECSAMIQKLFGERIDIHGGGLDLLFPHHENEIAQSEACSGQHFVNYWMHNNMLNFGGQKMSKSLGNFVTMRDFLKKYHAEIYKWMILSVHYRSVADFSDEAVDRAIQGLAKIYSSLALAQDYASQGADLDPTFEEITAQAWKKIEESFCKDFATPEIFAQIFEVTRAFNGQVKRLAKPPAASYAKARSYQKFIKKVGQLLCLFEEPASQFLRQMDDLLLEKMNLNRSEIQKLVDARAQARELKDFQKSDQIRDQLLKMGVSVMDTAQGALWEVTK